MGIFASYEAVATKLGLTFDQDYRIHGSVDGVPVTMWFETHATHVAAILVRPATVEFSLTTKGLAGKFGDLFGGHNGGLGDPAFDKVFALKTTASLDVVGRLLDANARKTLLEIASEDLHPAATQTTVHLHRWSSGAPFDAEPTIERDFREAARLSRVLSASFVSAR